MKRAPQIFNLSKLLKNSKGSGSGASGQPPFLPPRAEMRVQEGGVSLSGEWTARSLVRAQAALSALPGGSPTLRWLSLDGISRLDTAGAMIINRFLLRPGRPPLELRAENPDYRSLLELCQPPPPVPAAPKKPLHLPDRIAGLGENVVGLGSQIAHWISFFGAFLVNLWQNLLHPWSIRWTSLVWHMDQTGVRALPIVALLSFLIGTVIAYMTASQLAYLGAQIFVVKLLEIGVMREMGVLITAILVAGRSASSFTAQIGAMIVNQEVDAMRSMGLNPLSLLVTPRVLALVFTLPALSIAADVMGMLGGMVAVWASLDITPFVFMHTLHDGIALKNVLLGLLKAPFFAVVIGCAGCYRGFCVSGSSESVGRMTTQAVVESIFMVIALDALFALFFMGLGV